jgi:hypothetical protein
MQKVTLFPASLSIAIVDSSLVQPANALDIVSDYFENNDQLSCQ